MYAEFCLNKTEDGLKVKDRGNTDTDTDTGTGTGSVFLTDVGSFYATHHRVYTHNGRRYLASFNAHSAFWMATKDQVGETLDSICDNSWFYLL